MIEENTYRLHNNETKEWADVPATSSYKACEKVGWLFQDCHIRMLPPTIKKESK